MLLVGVIFCHNQQLMKFIGDNFPLSLIPTRKSYSKKLCLYLAYCDICYSFAYYYSLWGIAVTPVKPPSLISEMNRTFEVCFLSRNPHIAMTH